MHYLIDGHNLIGHCRSIRLGDPDDEAKIVDLLHRWVLRLQRHTVTVVFDGGVYGHPYALDRPGVKAVFAHSPQDADARLARMIERVPNAARTRVVTSDRVVAATARTHKLEVISASSFAAQLEQPPGAPRKPSNGVGGQHSRKHRPRLEAKLSPAEVEHWLREFGIDEPAAD